MQTKTSLEVRPLALARSAANRGHWAQVLSSRPLTIGKASLVPSQWSCGRPQSTNKRHTEPSALHRERGYSVGLQGFLDLSQSP